MWYLPLLYLTCILAVMELIAQHLVVQPQQQLRSPNITVTIMFRQHTSSSWMNMRCSNNKSSNRTGGDDATAAFPRHIVTLPHKHFSEPEFSCVNLVMWNSEVTWEHSGAMSAPINPMKGSTYDRLWTQWTLQVWGTWRIDMLHHFQIGNILHMSEPEKYRFWLSMYTYIQACQHTEISVRLCVLETDLYRYRWSLQSVKCYYSG